MATSSSYYLNAPSLGSATAIFTDAALSTCAPDGFYSNGVIVRELVGCNLLPQQTCPTCATPCGTTINASGGQGIYLLDLDTGTTVADVGAVIVRFDPYAVPDGIRATLGSNTYNSLTSPVDGFHQSSNVGAITYIGQTSGDCGISGTTYPASIEYLYDGTLFVATGNTQSITVAPGDVSLGTSAPGNTMMVIPKTVPSPSIINFEAVGPCSGTAWTMSVDCPVLLTGFSSSVMAADSTAVCALSETVTYYNASLTGTPGIVGLYDFVFADAYGSTILTAGYYLATGSITGSNDWFQVGAGGVVIALGVCVVPPEVSYNCVSGTCVDPGDGTGTYSTLESCEADCSVSCLEYTIWTTSGSGQTFTYIDCLGNPQSGNIGGASGYDAETFCAEEGTVIGTSETTTVLNGPCPPEPVVSYNCVSGTCVDPGDGTGTYATLVDCEADCSAPLSATLSWTFNETAGAISAMDLYVNGSIVESRSATSSGTYTVYEGDTISLEINVTGCSVLANAYCVGIINENACDPSVTFLSTSNYTVINADLGTVLGLDMFALCDTACV